MEYPKYSVGISYVRPYPNGQQLVNINSITQSIPSYEGGYYIANMQIVNISATGSTYESALSNLLLVATASSTILPGQTYY